MLIKKCTYMIKFWIIFDIIYNKFYSDNIVRSALISIIILDVDITSLLKYNTISSNFPLTMLGASCIFAL